MHRALLACLVACKFDPGAPVPDAEVSAMLTIDAGPPPCSLGVTSTTGTDRGTVGLSTGGGTSKMLSCPSGLVVGIALDMSDQPVNSGATPSAHGIELGCATVTLDAAGGHTGMVTPVLLDGSGGAGFTPSTLTPLTQCGGGGVVSGLAVHGGPQAGLFLDATVTCTRFDRNGQPASTTPQYISGSATDNSNPSSATCNAGEQIVAMATDTGAGVDTVHLLCAPTKCE